MSSQEPSPDVPIFLRKTYSMVNTCDPEVCSWDEDGKTFTVKDPDKFEKEVIPQWFKHSKFSSFVRQLNFYSFRKIKYDDSLRIDVEREKMTANYWRFRHDNFQRGRPELLLDMKRTGCKSSSTQKATTTTPDKTASSKTTVVVAADKNEVQSLKKRIEEMSKNMDKLTEMVQKVSLEQEKQQQQEQTTEITEMVGSKRKKVADDADLPVPELPTSEMDIDDVDALLPELPLSAPDLTPPEPASRETSDNTFVDELFSAFNEDDNLFQEEVLMMQQQQVPEEKKPVSNRPDPELMERLSDALEVLPKKVQEMIVNRLIASITSTEGFAKIGTGKALPVEDSRNDEAADTSEGEPMPLAAATLAALLHHYTNQVKQQQGGNSSKKLQKYLPVIPVHA